MPETTIEPSGVKKVLVGTWNAVKPENQGKAVMRVIDRYFKPKFETEEDRNLAEKIAGWTAVGLEAVGAGFVTFGIVKGYRLIKQSRQEKELVQTVEKINTAKVIIANVLRDPKSDKKTHSKRKLRPPLLRDEAGRRKLVKMANRRRPGKAPEEKLTTANLELTLKMLAEARREDELSERGDFQRNKKKSEIPVEEKILRSRKAKKSDRQERKRKREAREELQPSDTSADDFFVDAEARYNAAFQSESRDPNEFARERKLFLDILKEITIGSDREIESLLSQANVAADDTAILKSVFRLAALARKHRLDESDASDNMIDRIVVRYKKIMKQLGSLL